MGLLDLASLRAVRHFIPAYSSIPNSTATNKSLLIYPSVLSGSVEEVERHLTETGVVSPAWRYTMYSQDHFHSTSHEVLTVVNGKAKLCFGHQNNPSCVMETFSKGDGILIPAGISHRLIDDIEGGFLMVGSYPNGKSWDMCYGGEDEKEKVDSIKSLQWFKRDPFYGDVGPAVDM